MRHEAMARAFSSGAYTMQEIAEHFGVHYSTVSRAVRRFERSDAGKTSPFRPHFGPHRSTVGVPDGRQPQQRRERRRRLVEQPGGRGMNRWCGRWWLALCCAFGLAFAATAGAGRILVPVHGYLGDSASWQQSGVLPVLEQAGWKVAGIWRSTPAGVRLETVEPPAGAFVI
ncbi:MAG: helix-turn-helix domain-containing protein [Thiocapsa sp. C3-sup]